jgi:hypothetical protein
MGLLLPASHQKTMSKWRQMTKIRLHTTRDAALGAIQYLLDDSAELRKKKPLSERQLVEEVIGFVNSGDFIHLMKLLGGFHMDLKPGDAFLTPEFMSVFDEDREWLRNLLSKAISGRVDTAMLDEISERASRMLQLPQFVINNSKLQIAHHYLCEHVHAPMAYTVLLVLDESRPFASSLCQCQLHSCSRFFFAYKPPTGRPRTRYCSDEHMHEAHAAESSQRVAASRNNRKKLKSIAKPRKAK